MRPASYVFETPELGGTGLLGLSILDLPIFKPFAFSVFLWLKCWRFVKKNVEGNLNELSRKLFSRKIFFYANVFMSTLTVVVVFVDINCRSDVVVIRNFPRLLFKKCIGISTSQVFLIPGWITLIEI